MLGTLKIRQVLIKLLYFVWNHFLHNFFAWKTDVNNNKKENSHHWTFHCQIIITSKPWICVPTTKWFCEWLGFGNASWKASRLLTRKNLVSHYPSKILQAKIWKTTTRIKPKEKHDTLLTTLHQQWNKTSNTALRSFMENNTGKLIIFHRIFLSKQKSSAPLNQALFIRWISPIRSNIQPPKQQFQSNQ